METEPDVSNVTNEDLELANSTLATITTLLEIHDWAALTAEASRTEAIAPILDPTWYLNHSDAVRSNHRLYSATATYLAELHKIVDEAKTRAAR